MSKTATVLLFILAISAVTCHAVHDHKVLHGRNQDHHHDPESQHSHEHEHDHDHDHHQTDENYQVESHVYILTDETLQDALDEFPLILVKFFAPWCGHCKTLASVYKELAIELAHSDDNQYVIAEVDCTIHKEACNKHGIRGYPTLKYFIDGEAHQYSGQRSKQSIIQWLAAKQSEVRSTKQQEEL